MMDAAERALFSDAIGRAASGRSGDELDAALGELGWTEALAADRPAAVAVLFEALGNSNATSSALDVVLSTALGAPDPDAAAFVLPPLRAVEPPGRHDGGQIAVVGLGTRALAHRDTAVIVTSTPDSSEAFVVPAPALKVEPTHGLDPSLGLVEVSGEFDLASLPVPSVVDWGDVVAVGQLCLGHELVGAGRTMLDLARRHALERIQFGRPIASFQAVQQHLVAIAQEASLVGVAAEGAARVPGSFEIAAAKVVASRAALTATRAAHQVHGAIGMTQEYRLHHFSRRLWAWRNEYGDEQHWAARLGSTVAAAGADNLYPAVTGGSAVI